jgi:prevent-host-death family protein
MTRLLVIAGAYMVTVTLAQAKAQLSALPDRVEDGEDILITGHGRPVAHLPAAAPTITRLPRAFLASRKPACEPAAPCIWPSPATTARKPSTASTRRC